MKKSDDPSLAGRLELVFKLLNNGLLDRQVAIDFLNSSPEEERRKFLTKEFNNELKGLLDDE